MRWLFQVSVRNQKMSMLINQCWLRDSACPDCVLKGLQPFVFQTLRKLELEIYEKRYYNYMKQIYTLQ